MAPPRNIRFARSKDAIGRDLDIARARKEFFPNRPDVSDDRALRRQQQADQLAAFKGQFTKPVEGATGLVQMTQDAPRTLAQEEMRLANILGPTPREIGSDFMRGLGSFTSDLSNRIQSGSFGILGVAKDLYNRASDALRSGVNSLSSVDLEIVKNKNKYPFASNKSKLQGIQQLEADAKLAANVEKNAGIIAANRDLFGDYSEFGGPSLPGEVEKEPLESLIPSTLYEMPQQPPGFKVASPEQRAFLKEIREADKMYDGIISSKQPTSVVKEVQPTGQQFIYPKSYTIPFTNIEVPSLMRQVENVASGGQGLMSPDSDFFRDESGKLIFDPNKTIRIQNKIATPVSEEDFAEVQKKSDAMFNEPFFQQ